MAAKTLVTPALPYANGAIHLGHLVEHVQVNVFVRALRMAGEDVLYVCGADSHGTPIELKAMQEGISPADYAAKWQASHKTTFTRFGIDFDGGYGTTHTPENEKHAARIYAALKDAGRTKRKTVKQFYDPQAERFLPDRFLRGTCPFCKTPDQYGDACESCNKTYDPTDLIDPKSAISGATPVQKETEHLFVDLAAFADQLKAWTSKEGAVAGPVQNFLKGWLEDLRDWDISRDGPYFGFPIPGEDNKFFYVWLDAPIGYISLCDRAAKERGESWEDYWKDPDTKIYHFIGKDILYFHTLFWPAMLMAAGDTVPTQVPVHGFLTIDGEKMSKTRGTFINADAFSDLLGDIGVEALRYYYCCKLNGGIDDIDFSLDDFVARVNTDLVNKVVNLVSRTVPMLHRNFEGCPGTFDPGAADLVATVRQLASPIEADYRSLNFAKVVRDVVKMADEGNKYLQDNKPWELTKTSPEKAQQVLSTALWIGKSCLALLSPIVPQVSQKLAAMLHVEGGFTFANALADFETGVALEPYDRLFERLDPKVVKNLIPKAEDAAKAAPKKGKAEKKQAAPKTDTLAEEITIDDFVKIDLRAAKVLSALDVEKSKKLIEVKVDLGPLGERTIYAGLRPHVEASALVGKMIAVVANLKPRVMKGVGTSEGMVLAAGDVPAPLSCEGAAPGDKIG